MFYPLRSLLKRQAPAFDEEDIRHLVQRYLQQELKTDRVVCESVRGGRVTIRTGSPTIQQDVRLIEYDLKRWLKHEVGYSLTSLTVRTS